ncbi:MAG: polysulfide reductase NrfD [Deltaproteobacteria bacterium]|nr:polysulfide reductase NrfD [Deltaproteobacteria bacterium]
MEQPILIGRPTDEELTDQLLAPTWTPHSRTWLLGLALSGAGTLLLGACITYTVVTGIGVWGTTIPIGWAFPIINFVWWIGIGHAGTFISAILLLVEQRWRTSINRFAEGMTLFAVIQAGIFPVLHLGRPWFAYWLFPYPDRMKVWPQLKSALPWDAAAVLTYFTVSLLFWYLGLVPDLASLRDRAPTTRMRRVYGVFALGWRGSGRHWQHYRIAYGLIAGLAAPLVVSVHSIVSSDFAITILPGWHSTIFPPFFVAGAIFSGFAMVITLVIPTRKFFHLENVITLRHLENMAKMLLVTGGIVTYAYILELFISWYSGDRYEQFTYLEARPFGPAAWVFWIMIACNALVPQLFWWKRMRRSIAVLFVASLLINLGMWAERFVIIVHSLQRDFLPSSWADYAPTWVDIGIFIGTISFFSFLFLLFLRFVPFVPLAEIKEMKAEMAHEEKGVASPDGSPTR